MIYRMLCRVLGRPPSMPNQYHNTYFSRGLKLSNALSKSFFMNRRCNVSSAVSTLVSDMASCHVKEENVRYIQLEWTILW
jgi:hypothetical protein